MPRRKSTYTIPDQKPLPGVVPPSAEEDPAILVSAPKDFFLGPVFAATKQTGPRDVTVGMHRYQIGGFHPIHPTRVPPALDVRHARLIFALLSFRDPFDSTRLIRFSFNELSKRYARSNGGRYARDIKALVGDLMDTYIRLTDSETSVSHSYRMIERIDIEERPIRRRDAARALSLQQELWFNGATLSPEFFSLLSRIIELQHLRLDVFTSIRSPLAQAIYLYIPSRAAHRSEKRPFEISLSNLLEQVSHPIPATRKLRKKLFTQHRTSILSQLHGKETLTGTFRVQLANTSDKSDYKLQAWVEPKKHSKPVRKEVSKLEQAFLQGGRSSEELEKRLRMVAPLEEYDYDLLSRGEIEIDGNTRFFQKAKALLGRGHFHSLLSEAKGDALEKRPATKSPTARLIYRTLEALRNEN